MAEQKKDGPNNVTSYAARVVSPTPDMGKTVKIYRDAVSFFVSLINQEWETSHLDSLNQSDTLLAVEKLSHKTSKNPNPKYPFDQQFPYFPSYFRRAAIVAARGAVSSYRSNHLNWENADPKTRGSEPKLGKSYDVMPAFYRHNMSHIDEILQGKSTTAELRLYNGKEWVWETIHLSPQDAKFLAKKAAEINNPKKLSCAPVLEFIDYGRIRTRPRKNRGKNKGKKKSGKRKHLRASHPRKRVFLRFAFTWPLDLMDVPLEDRRILSVDLGINTPATCSVMLSDGTVVARKFIDFAAEKDRMERFVGKARRAQREHGRTGGKYEWARARNINEEISVRTAKEIVDFAVSQKCHVIVLEHLNTNGKKRGRNKWRLHMWRSRFIQNLVERKAHHAHMRISTICAWGTSKLAFDGSGQVERHISVDGQPKNYSICRFKTGKIYNCDLNASYNIGARYLLREWCKLVPDLNEKLPSSSHQTLADLRALDTKQLLLSTQNAHTSEKKAS